LVARRHSGNASSGWSCLGEITIDDNERGSKREKVQAEVAVNLARSSGEIDGVCQFRVSYTSAPASNMEMCITINKVMDQNKGQLL